MNYFWFFIITIIFCCTFIGIRIIVIIIGDNVVFCPFISGTVVCCTWFGVEINLIIMQVFINLDSIYFGYVVRNSGCRILFGVEINLIIIWFGVEINLIILQICVNLYIMYFWDVVRNNEIGRVVTVVIHIFQKYPPGGFDWFTIKIKIKLGITS